jgi:L-iditol 2-dehydrogenase
MKALVKFAPGKGNMELRDVPEPKPGPGEVKIAVKAASICGSDLHIRHGDIGIPMRLPVTMGHEFAGVVAECGAGVEGVQAGDRVTAENTRTCCGTCPQCASGSYNLCTERLATGYAYDGAFAPFVVVPQVRVHRLPDNVDFRCGSLTDPSACAYHAVQELTRINAAETVLITGPGPMGLFSLQYVKANGGTAILVGRPKDSARLKLGQKLGADFAISGGDLHAQIQKITNGRGVDVALECSGAEPAAQLALRALRREGRYTQVGIFGKPVTFDLDEVLYKEIRLIGSFSQKFLGWERALELCSLGKIQVSPLITHEFRLDAWKKAFDLFEKGKAIKVVFNME